MSLLDQIEQTDTADLVVAKLLARLKENSTFDVYGTIQDWCEIKNTVPMTNEEFEELEKQEMDKQ